MSFNLNAQVLRISGKVMDVKSEIGISDFSILENNTNIGTISNFDGSFSIFLKPGNIELKFENSKYETFLFKFQLKSDTIFKVKLNPIQEMKRFVKYERKI